MKKILVFILLFCAFSQFGKAQGGGGAGGEETCEYVEYYDEVEVTEAYNSSYDVYCEAAVFLTINDFYSGPCPEPSSTCTLNRTEVSFEGPIFDEQSCLEAKEIMENENCHQSCDNTYALAESGIQQDAYDEAGGCTVLFLANIADSAQYALCLQAAAAMHLWRFVRIQFEHTQCALECPDGSPF